MRIFVKVKTRAKKVEVRKIDDENFVISVTEVPEKGKANKAVISALAKHLNIPKLRIKIILGLTSEHKVLEV